MTALVKQRTARDPVTTRHAILDAATTVLAKDGPDLLNVSKVAHLAGVNRGTAYKYFPSREALVTAAIDRMSEQLFIGVFGSQELAGEQGVTDISIEDLTVNIIEFAMENPDFGRVWLLEILSSRGVSDDLFWSQFSGNFARFAETERCEKTVDAEVLSVLFLGAFFLWPVFAKAHPGDMDNRKELARRLSRETMRLVAHGIVDPHKIRQMNAPTAS